MDSSEETRTTKHEPNLQIINGFPFSLMFKEETIEEALSFKSGKGDVIVATYPKTETTWMQYIVLQIITDGKDFPQFNDVLEKCVPYLELTGISAIEALQTRPRAYKTHMPYNMMNVDPGAKIIYVYRKPDDTFVSYYHFMNNLMGSLDFDEYFEDFLCGNVSYGSYFDHITSFWKNLNKGNILMVSYEKLQAHTREEVLKVAKFVGQEFYERLVNDESVLTKILRNISFGHMQKNLTLIAPKNPAKDKFSKEVEQKCVDFFRKGKVGEGKKNLKGDQLKRLKTLAKEKLKGTELIEEWYNN